MKEMTPFRMVPPCRSHSSRAPFSRVVLRSISKRRRQAAESQIGVENAHVQYVDYVLIVFMLEMPSKRCHSNFRVSSQSFHVCSRLFMSFHVARGAPKSLHIPLGPRKERNPGSLQLERFALDSSTYSGHLEGASLTSCNHGESVPVKSLQAFA